MSRRGRHNRHHGTRTSTDSPGEVPASARPQEGPPVGTSADNVREAAPQSARPAAAIFEPVAAGTVVAVPTGAQTPAALPVNATREPANGTSGADAAAQMQNAADSGEPLRPTCTTAQLRRFIKSRPWIPMHELRRRFGIMGGDDDVTPVRVGEHTLFIGLPPAEGRLMGELLASGDVGYELSLDPITPIVVGVYPMRPVPRG